MGAVIRNEEAVSRALEQENCRLAQELRKLKEEIGHRLQLLDAYKQRVSDLEKEVEMAKMGGRLKRTFVQKLTDKLGLTQHKLANALRASGEFDSRWYLEQYPDVAEEGIDPVEHFVRHGVKEGRNPSPWFDTGWYLEEYPDVAESGVNPLLHYHWYGKKEGRNPGPECTCAPVDPLTLEQEWLRKARDEQEQLASERQERIDALVDQRDQLEHQVQAAEKQLESLRQTNATLEQEKAVLAAQRAELAERVEELTNARGEQEQLANERQGHIDALEGENQELLTQLHKVQEGVEQQLIQIEQLRVEQATLNGENVELVDQRGQLEHQVQAAEKQLESLRQTNATLKQEKAVLAAQRAELAERVEELTNARGEQEQLASERQEQIQNLYQLKAQLEVKLSDAERQFAVATAEADTLRQLMYSEREKAEEQFKAIKQLLVEDVA